MTGKQETPFPNPEKGQPEKEPEREPTKQKKGQEPIEVKAPRYHASASQTFMQQRQQQHVRDKVDPGVPDSARQPSPDDRYVPLPAGGIAALADHLYPDDVDNEEKMHEHVFHLQVANRHLLRDDTGSTVGTMVRIP